MRLEQINKPIQERMPASIIKHKQKLAHMTDKELADRHGDKDEKTLRQMAWRHGYGNMSSHYWDRIQNTKTNVKEYRNVVTPRDEAHYRELMKHLQDMELDPTNRRDSDLMAEIRRRRLELRAWAEKNIKREGFIGKKMQYNDFLQNKLDQAIQEFDTPEKKAERDALMQKYLNKGGKVEKVPAGVKAYKGKELKPAYKKNNGTPITSPGSDESAEETEVDPGGRFQTDDPGYYKNPDKEFNINGLTTKKDVVQSIIDNIDNNELDTAKDSLNQLLDVVTALHEDAGEQAMANEISDLFARRANDMLKDRPGRKDQEWEEMDSIAQAFKKGIEAGLEEVNMSDFEFSNNPFGDFGRGIDDGPEEDLVDVLNKYGYQPGPDRRGDKPSIVKSVEEEKVDYANLMFRGKEIDHNSIEYEMQDFSDMIYELHGAKYIDGTELDDDELEELEKTGEMLDWISADYASSGPDAPDDYPVGEVAPPGREKPATEDAGEDEKVVDMLRNIRQHLDNHPNMSEHPSLVALDQLADDLESGDKPADYESVQEEAPFNGKGILQRAVFNKWISAEEWFHLQDEWKQAYQELEQRYDDWPEGQGFGTSDHNWAIKELMELVGYEFDDLDRTGKFVVTKMPEKLEKKGITNTRMRKEPVAQESQPNEPTASQLSDEELAELIGSDPKKEGFDVAVEWVRTHREEAEEIGNEVNIGHADIGEAEDESIPRILGKAEASLMHGLELAGDVLAKDWNQATVRADIISKNWPALIEKLKNIYKKTEDDDEAANGIHSADLKRLGQSEPKIYVHKDGKTILIPKSKAQEYIAKGWKQSRLRAEASYESKLAEMLKQRLK